MTKKGLSRIDNHEITIVIQGPVISSANRPQEADVTCKSLAAIRQHYPGAKIILSTWPDQKAEGLDYDQLVINDDPGPTIIRYHKNGKPHKVNVNRQIVSTLGGLREVKTPYAMKLRSDNVLNSDYVKRLFMEYQKRSEDYRLLERRVVASNLYAKEFSQGLRTPFFPSDFFYFGRTEDLLKIWDINLFPDYVFREELTGRRQHANYPWPQLHVEQMLWTAFVRKFMKLEFKNKYFIGNGVRVVSEKIFANNLIIAERGILKLEVPERLQQKDGFPYTFYTHRRWQQLYKKHVDPDYVLNNDLYFSLYFRMARFYKGLTEGLKQRYRLFLCRLGQS